ncbi:MAG: hypothetical protein IJD10_00915 [Clostridia bacterium]|nr:hypothetical protein [Clostridia bacterium]
MKRNYRADLKHGLLTALTVAPGLSVMLLSGIYQVSAEFSGYGGATPVLLGLLALLAVLASSVLAVIWRKPLGLAMWALLFWLCFISYFGICVSGSADWFSDPFFQAMTLVFAFPVSSYLPLIGGLGDYTAAAALLLTGVLAILPTVAAVWLTKGRGHRG